jgi:hypothetical protein
MFVRSFATGSWNGSLQRLWIADGRLTTHGASRWGRSKPATRYVCVRLLRAEALLEEQEVPDGYWGRGGLW